MKKNTLMVIVGLCIASIVGCKKNDSKNQQANLVSIGGAATPENINGVPEGSNKLPNQSDKLLALIGSVNTAEGDLKSAVEKSGESEADKLALVEKYDNLIQQSGNLYASLPKEQQINHIHEDYFKNRSENVKSLNEFDQAIVAEAVQALYNPSNKTAKSRMRAYNLVIRNGFIDQNEQNKFILSEDVVKFMFGEK